MSVQVTITTDVGFDPVVLTMDSKALTDLEKQATVTWVRAPVRRKPAPRETTLEEIELQLGQDSATNPDEEPQNWIDVVVVRAGKLCDLPRGWDGSGSPPLLPTILAAAQDLLEQLRNVIPADLPDPFVCPLSGGGLQIEVTSDTKHLEIMFDGPSEIIFLKEENVAGEEVMDSGQLSARDVPNIKRLFKWFDSA